MAAWRWVHPLGNTVIGDERDAYDDCQEHHCGDDTNLYTRTQVTEQAPEDDVSIIADALRVVSTRPLRNGSAACGR